MIHIGYYHLSDEQIEFFKEECFNQGIKAEIKPIGEIASFDIKFRQLAETQELLNLYEKENKTYPEYGWFRKFEKKRF